LVLLWLVLRLGRRRGGLGLGDWGWRGG
jgi:hypothetical protein